MVFLAIGLTLVTPILINISNRIVVEELIPNRKAKKASKANKEGNDLGDVPRPISLDMAITPNEMAKLDELGATPILIEARERHERLMATGEACLPVCEHCHRLN